MSPPSTKILVIGDKPAQRARLARLFEDRGIAVAQAATPLDAIVNLHGEQAPITLAVVAPTIGTTSGSDFAAFMADVFPNVAVLLVSMFPLGESMPALAQAS